MVGRRPWVALVVAGLVLAVLPSRADARLPVAHPAMAKHRPGCQTFFTGDEIAKAVGPGAALTSLQKAKASALFGSLIPHGQNCGYVWDTTAGYPPPGDPIGSCDPDSLGAVSDYSPGYGWIVSYDYSKDQWKRLERTQKHDPTAPDPNSNPNQPVTNVRIARKTKAFAVTDPAYCSPSGALPATALYVWTKHHDLLAIFLWPASQDAEIALASSVLHRKPTF